MKGMEMPMKQMEKMPPESTLQPAEGASVKIVSPKNGQVSMAIKFRSSSRWPRVNAVSMSMPTSMAK